MQSMSLSAKTEISRLPQRETCCISALLSAAIHTAGYLSIDSSGRKIVITSDNPKLLMDAAGEKIAAMYDIKTALSQRELTLFCGKDLRLLFELGIMRLNSDGMLEVTEGIDSSLVEEECCARAYISGAFLGAGSLSVGSGGNQLRFSFPRSQQAADFAALIARFGVESRTLTGGEKYIVYIGRNQDISDCLALMGAAKTMLSFNLILVERQMRGDINRVNNIELANIEKTVDAGLSQIMAIKKIKAKKGAFDALPPILRQTAAARLKLGSEASYGQLADALGVSKGSVKYRLKKIEECADKINN